MSRYILENKKPVLEPTLFKWARFMENRKNIIVKQDDIKNANGEDFFVSTVFLGLDHSWSNEKPVLFETMIFPESESDDWEEYQERYCTWEEAKKGHKKAINYLTSTKNKND